MNWLYRLRFGVGATLSSGAVTTRTGLRALGGDDAAIGSVFTSTTNGVGYLKIADAKADADWGKITVTNAD